MKKDRVINPEIISEIAALGHTEYLCIADCGLPIPKDVKVVDVSVTAGIPRFMDVLRAASSELVVESYILADELRQVNCAGESEIKNLLRGIPEESVPHEKLKELTSRAKCVIRTGETNAYMNIILVGGVNF